MPQDIPHITAVVTPIEYPEIATSRYTVTYRDTARKRLIIKTLDEHSVTLVIDLCNAVQRQEKAEGYKDEMCSKSMQRLLQNLTRQQIVSAYCLTLAHGEHARVYRYVTHPKVTPEHPAMQYELLRMKHNFFNSLEERRLRENMASKQLKTTRKPKPRTKKCVPSAKKKLYQLPKEVLRGAAAQKPPKFLISRYMHEFLYYIVVELGYVQPACKIDAELLQRWQQTSPDLQAAEYLSALTSNDSDGLETQELRVYSAEELSWRSFISPLPCYSDKPAGWVYMLDVIDRLPLSIFNKIFRIDKDVDDRLALYLSHPVRQHYLLQQLPIELRHCISRQHQYNIYIQMLKLLNHLGLVQVNRQPAATILPSTGGNKKLHALMFWVYVNRQVLVKDTTTTEESYAKINAKQQYETLRYELKSFADVMQYWASLHRVCVYTKLGFRAVGRELKGRSKREKDLEFLDSVNFDQAPLLDVGVLPGDGLGAAGLSTKLYAHIFRNWSWVTASNSEKCMPARRKQLRATLALQTLRRNRPKLAAPLVRRMALGARTKRSGVAKKNRGPRDQIDRDALKNMRTLRVTWHGDEDDFLKMARAVYMYVSAPINMLGLLAVGKISRDLIRHHLGICNKTIQACVRRSHFIIRMQRHVPQVPTWLNMLQTNAQMKRQYGDDFLKKLKQVYAERAECSAALEKHFILIMRFLYKIVREGDNGELAMGAHTAQPKFLLPNSVNEFYRRFCIRGTINSCDDLPAGTSADATALTTGWLNPSNEFELQVTLVIGVLHSLLCCARDKTPYNLQAFEIYKHYSEEVLHAAFSKARSNALVIPLKRKNLALGPTQLAAPAYALSAKYRMRLTYMKMPYSIYDVYFAVKQTVIKNCLQNGVTKGTPGSKSGKKSAKSHKGSKGEELCGHAKSALIELKSPTTGQLLFLAEGFACNHWHIDVQLPVNILTVDAEQNQSVHSMDRILDHYHCIFDNAPRTEYAKNFEIDTRDEKQVSTHNHQNSAFLRK